MTIIRSIKYIKHVIRLQQSQHKALSIIKNQQQYFLELGAGKKKGTHGWITLDLKLECDLYWDLRQGLPFPDNSIYKIYSSHVFEHFTFKEGQKLFDECFRVLISGGIFSICVPNVRLYVEAYMYGNSDRTHLLRYKPADNQTSKIDYLNYMAYMDGHHKYMFDQENLLLLLERKCFRNVRLRAFDPDLDKEERRYESIYAEAQK